MCTQTVPFYFLLIWRSQVIRIETRIRINSNKNQNQCSLQIFNGLPDANIYRNIALTKFTFFRFAIDIHELSFLFFPSRSFSMCVP